MPYLVPFYDIVDDFAAKRTPARYQCLRRQSRTRAAGLYDAAHASGSLESGDGVLEDCANTVSAMELGDGLADRLAQDAEEPRLRWVDDHHVQAFLPRRRRDFRADEPHAHDHGSAAGNHRCPNAIGVLNRAKAVDALKIATGNREASVAPARGDEQRVERPRDDDPGAPRPALTDRFASRVPRTRSGCRVPRKTPPAAPALCRTSHRFAARLWKAVVARTAARVRRRSGSRRRRRPLRAA
jgi:hypothetical protein